MNLPTNKFAILSKIQSIQPDFLRLKILDKVFTAMIPFNRGLGFEIKKLDQESCMIFSPEKRKRQNHVGGAHACALAVLGEYTAGLLLAQHYSPEKYRFIIAHLEAEYHKQGRGTLEALCLKPDITILNPVTENGDKEMFVDLSTEIKNSQGELVAIIKTKWQAKPWELVRSKN